MRRIKNLNSMGRDLCISYSFSFQKKTCQDIQYYRKTTPKNTLKINVENFIINFMKNHNDIATEELSVTRGRLKGDNTVTYSNRYLSFQFSLKKSTITKIRKYKKLPDSLDLDKYIEKYIKQLIPTREA